MTDPREELKIRARHLQRKAALGQDKALDRLRRRTAALKNLEDDDLMARVSLSHCQATIARELGFSSWQHAHQVLGGEPHPQGYGSLLCPPRASGFTNHWTADLEEARALRMELGGTLLAFKRQYFVVQPEYLEAVGLDPEDPAWGELDHDWTWPEPSAARCHFYGQLLAEMPQETP